MMKPIRNLLIALLCLFACHASAQMTIVYNGKAKARIIVVDDAAGMNRRAASLLNKFIQRMTGVTLPIEEAVVVADASSSSLQSIKTGAAFNKLKPENGLRKGDILLGGLTDSAGEDGFRIVCRDGHLTIESGGDKGTVQGVVRLLEKYFHCDYYAYHWWSAPKRSSLRLPDLDWTETPAFRYRQTQTYSADDPDFKAWYGLEEPSDMFAANMWVHTFNQILPASRFGKAHPEWYSMINGRRQPGDHAQWCLTNEELFHAVCHQLDSIFAAHPDKKMISISQNDGNNTQCHCHECLKMEQEEGSPSGPIIYFLNKLAAHYPDKEFSTLAYLFSVQPPRNIKPLPNVNIMLCDIDCRREVPLTDNESGRYFMRAIDGWAKISQNIFVWDYGINFDAQVSPFPNFHILQPNMQIFRSHHANMLFEQVNGTVGTDMSELRAYLICKLMRNPDQDVDLLMRRFLGGYYGAAATCIYRYVLLRQGGLLASQKPLWIYDSPITHKDGMLNRNMMRQYDALFDEAEERVAADSALLDHVRLSRLPLQYAALEIARTRADKDEEKLRSDLNLFRERSLHFGVRSLNERNNPPADYCDLYAKRYLAQKEKSKAIGAKVTFIKGPSKPYDKIASTALTDGLYGGTGYVESWVGWNGTDAEFIIDLGRPTEFSRIATDFLQQSGAWVLWPKSVSYAISVDGNRYEPFGKEIPFAEDRRLSVMFREAEASSPQPVSARYIRVSVSTIGNCPSWHYGVGYPAWFFLDEVSVF